MMLMAHLEGMRRSAMEQTASGQPVPAGTPAACIGEFAGVIAELAGLVDIPFWPANFAAFA
jgi:hypothetical protein